MVTVVFNNPQWFFGIDSVLGAIATVVSLMVFLASLKLYRVTKDNKFSYFGFAFGSLTLAFGVRTFADILLNHYFKQSAEQVLYGIFSSSTVFLVGYLMHIFFSLLAYIILLSFVFDIKRRKTFILFLVLLMGILGFSHSYYLSFYLASLIMLFFISVHYFRNCLTRKGMCSCMVFLSFFALTLTQLFFLLQQYDNIYYLVAYITQFLGYLGLFGTIVSVWMK